MRCYKNLFSISDITSPYQLLKLQLFESDLIFMICLKDIAKLCHVILYSHVCTKTNASQEFLPTQHTNIQRMFAFNVIKRRKSGRVEAKIINPRKTRTYVNINVQLNFHQFVLTIGLNGFTQAIFERCKMTFHKNNCSSA